jgi:hypothetical protein
VGAISGSGVPGIGISGGMGSVFPGTGGTTGTGSAGRSGLSDMLYSCSPERSARHAAGTPFLSLGSLELTLVLWLDARLRFRWLLPWLLARRSRLLLVLALLLFALLLFALLLLRVLVVLLVHGLLHFAMAAGVAARGGKRPAGEAVACRI